MQSLPQTFRMARRRRGNVLQGMGIAAFLAGCLLLGRLVAEYVPPAGVQPKVTAGAQTGRHQPKVPEAASSSVHTSAWPVKDEWTHVLATGTVIGALAAACVAFVVAAKGIPGVQPTGYFPTSGAVFNITHNHFHNYPEEAGGKQRREEQPASQAMPVLAASGLLSAGLLAGEATSKRREEGKGQGSLEEKVSSKFGESGRLSDLAKQVEDAQEENGSKRHNPRRIKQLGERYEREKQREPSNVNHAQSSEELAMEHTARATPSSSPSETMQIRGLFEREKHREISSAPHVQESEASATEGTKGTTWRLRILKSRDEKITWLNPSKVLKIREEGATLNALSSEALKIHAVRAEEDLQRDQAPQLAADAVERAQATLQVRASPEGMVHSGGACKLRHVRSMATSQPLTTSMEQNTLDVWKKPSKMVSDETVKWFQSARASQRRTPLPAMRNRRALSPSPSSPAMRSRSVMTPPRAIRNLRDLSSPSSPARGSRVAMTPPPAKRNRIVVTPPPAKRSGCNLSSSTSSPDMGNRVDMIPRLVLETESP